MFKTGYRKTLETDDLYNPITPDKSEILGDRLERFVYYKICKIHLEIFLLLLLYKCLIKYQHTCPLRFKLGKFKLYI